MTVERVPEVPHLTVERVLIVNLTRFGDLLQTSPTIAGLRERHPGATITLLADKNFADVCEGIPGIDRIHRVDLDHLGRLLLNGNEDTVIAYRYVEQLAEELRAQRFDLALNFSSSRMTAVFMGLLGIRNVRGWSVSVDGMRVIRHPWARLFATMCLNRNVAAFNLVDCYRGMADGIGGARRLLYEVTPRARTFAAESINRAGAESGERLIALQLGASKPIRQWPTDSFAALGRRLAAAGHRVVLIGGNGDRALAGEVAHRIGERAIDLCGKTRIPELGAVLERADLLVTGDTGPMHMAAAVGTPIVALFFGPALPFDTGPYGADHLCLHAAVACAPCDHNVSCLDPFCRVEIGPDLVAAAVEARLALDWAALERLAQGGGSTRLYRTAFDRHGLFEVHALGDRPPTSADHLRRGYRATFLHELCGYELPAARPTPIDAGAFAELVARAAAGQTLAQRLANEAAGKAPEIERLKRLGDELEVLDGTIFELGSTRPEAAVLTQMFKLGKENLEGADVAALAVKTRALYGALERGARSMRALLSGVREGEVVQDARLHQ